jgi:hypothetical protein
MLANRFPLLLWWGPEYVCLYNDAYRPVLGPSIRGRGSRRRCRRPAWWRSTRITTRSPRTTIPSPPSVRSCARADALRAKSPRRWPRGWRTSPVPSAQRRAGTARQRQNSFPPGSAITESGDKNGKGHAASATRSGAWCVVLGCTPAGGQPPPVSARSDRLVLRPEPPGDPQRACSGPGPGVTLRDLGYALAARTDELTATAATTDGTGLRRLPPTPSQPADHGLDQDDG